MQHLDEGTIHAWLDGQLPRDEAASVEAHVAECRQCADAVAEARGLIAASSRILTALDGVPRDVAPTPVPHAEASVSDASAASQPIVPSSAAQRAQRRWFTGGTLAAAAMIIVAVGTVTIMRARDSGDVLMSARAPETSGPSVLDSATPFSSAVPAPPPAAAAPNAAAAGAREVKAPANTPGPAAANELRRDATDELRARAEAAPKGFVSADTTAVAPGATEAVQRAQVRQQIAGAEPQQVAEQKLLKDSKKQELDEEGRRLTVRGASSLSLQRPVDSAAIGRRAADAAATTTGGVRGRVTDANNTGLSGASIHVLDTSTGISTNEAGEYALGGLAAGAYKLVVRRVGYAPVTRDFTITVGQTASVNVVLAPAELALSEVVVTGSAAAEQRRAKTAGAPPRTAPTPAPAAPSAGLPPATLATGESSPIGCYLLGITSATRTRTAFRQVPRLMALDSVVVPANADGGIWYRARDIATANTLPNGRWRPSGPGAVEIEWTAGSRVARVVIAGLGQAKLEGTVEEIDRATATGEGGTVVASRRGCQ